MAYKDNSKGRSSKGKSFKDFDKSRSEKGKSFKDFDKSRGNKGKGFKSFDKSNEEGKEFKSGFKGRENNYGKGKPEFKKNDDYKNKHIDRENAYEEDEELKELQLEGRNAVLAALNGDKKIDKIFFKKGEIEGTLKVIRGKALDKGIICIETSKQNLEDMAKSHNHQGVIAICPAKEYVEVSEILDFAKSKGETPLILILDGITDTYNLGAILRTAQVCGVHGIIIPKRRSATLNYGVSKASAGAVNFVNVARVTNITREIEYLQEQGIWVVGTDFDGESMYKVDMKIPTAIVIGSEGEGISPLVKKNCDFVAKIPQKNDEIGSLNASVATGVILYEAVRQRG
ncbi:MAG: 23S rRNA (guanosine(2251)-2'-O)-methyltransferase RlmB [Lachnospirales bacterium]